MIDLRNSTAFYRTATTRFNRLTAARFLVLTSAIAGSSVFAADVTFNISLVGQSDPHAGSPFYAEVWGEGNYAYVGSDITGQGTSIFNISNPASPQYVTMYRGPQLDASEMEDVEVYNGIGYVGADVSTTSGTGVDIINLSNPANPVRLSRINSSIGGHNKVHTLSVSEGFLYTADNATDVIKIFNVSNPSSPQFKWSLDINAPTNVASHEVVVLNDRLYVASKWNGTTTCCGWTHIYDVSNVGTTAPVLLKAFDSGPRTHTVWPSDDGKTIIVAQERPDADVRIYDVSMINQPNDPDNPVLLNTLNRTNVGIDAHSPHHPIIRGNLLFLAWYEAGLQVFNIADPVNPVLVGSFDTYAGTSTSYNGDWGVYPFLGLDKVLLSDRQRGLIIVDATGVLAPGDYNQDGLVDAGDYDTWRQNVGTTNRAADGNKNGIVDAADYVVWRKHIGQIGPSNLGAGSASNGSSGIPEPSTALLLICGLAVAISCRLRNRAVTSAP